MAFVAIMLRVKPLYSIQAAKLLDKTLIEKYSLSSSQLIDKAGRLSAEIVDRENPSSDILILAGPGNNGADGLAMAETLISSHRVYVYYCYDKANDELKRRKDSLNGKIKVIDKLEKDYEVVVDAIFGFSFHGTIDEYLIKFLSSCNKVYALDIPTGFSYRAYKTITFTTSKKEFYFNHRSECGYIECVNPGFLESELQKSPDCLYNIDSSDYTYEKLSLTSYKNTRGHAAFIGGSLLYPGAALLASKALIKAGAGLVSIYSDKKTKEYVISNENSIINGVKADFSTYDSILLGSGWGEGDASLFEKAIASNKPIVIDADGLRFLKDGIRAENAIITPHVGEFKRLLTTYNIKDEISESTIRELSWKTGAVVVLKSSVVYITDGREIYVYDGENPSLGVGGSGDILGAIIASNLARGLDRVTAARNGVILHQEAGRSINKRLGFYSASELLEEVGRVCYRYIFSR